MLAPAVATERVKAIAGRYFEIIERLGQIDVFQSANRSSHEVCRDPSGKAGDVELMSLSIRECLDHMANCNASRDACQGWGLVSSSGSDCLFQGDWDEVLSTGEGPVTGRMTCLNS